MLRGQEWLLRWHYLVQSGPSDEVMLCIWFWECQKNYHIHPALIDRMKDSGGVALKEFFILYLQTVTFYHPLWTQLIKLAEEEDNVKILGIRFPKQNIEKDLELDLKDESLKLHMVQGLGHPPSIYSLAHTECSQCNNNKCRQPLLLRQLLSF